MRNFITTYKRRRIGIFQAETRDQAINSVYETLKASGTTPDRKLINAWPAKVLKSKTPS